MRRKYKEKEGNLTKKIVNWKCFRNLSQEIYQLENRKKNGRKKLILVICFSVGELSQEFRNKEIEGKGRKKVNIGNWTCLRNLSQKFYEKEIGSKRRKR